LKLKILMNLLSYNKLIILKIGKIMKYEILIIDEDEAFVENLSKELESFGCNIEPCYNLKCAYDILEVLDKYDYIILNLDLSDGCAEEFIETLSKEQTSKVIILTNDTDNQRRTFLFDNGVLDYFLKIVSVEKLASDIQHIFKIIKRNAFINILIVDNSSFMRNILKKALRPKRFQILEATNTKDAIEFLDKKNIQLVLLDHRLFDMDSIEFLSKIKSDKRFFDLPVIVLSDSANQDMITKVLKTGASDFVKKPFAIEQLLLRCDLLIKNYLTIQNIKDHEQELSESLKKAMQMQEYKTLFLANMSHEIRTPLNAILGFIDILLDDEDDAQKLKYLKIIQNSGDLLLNLVNDILDFSKIDSGKLEIHKEVFILDELYDMIVSIYNSVASAKGVKFCSYVDKNIPKYTYSDFIRIKQILANLLSNAIKFTPKDGTVTLGIKLVDNKIEFSVQDTGIGVAKENQAKIFELYTQEKSSTTRDFGGTGLGLNICTKLAQLLDGEILLESQLGKGSRFYFQIPIEEVTKEQVDRFNNSNKTLEDISQTFNNHIMLVEDNKTNQVFMTVLLKKYGLTFDIANDGIEAVEVYKNKKYDLILMDENMPNLNGSEATKLIREYEKQQNPNYTPIIALTANAIKGDKEKFIKAGMDDYLTKPINKVKLTEVLNKFLRNK